MKGLRKRVALTVACAASVMAAGSNAVAAPLASSDRAARAAPTTLPGVTKGVHAVGGRWIVAARPGVASSRLATQVGVAPLVPRLGLYVASETRAATFVARLRERGLFTYAEPDTPVVARALPADPLSNLQWWVNPLISPALVPPAPSGAGTLAIIESAVDLTHPEFTDGHVTEAGAVPGDPFHGTAVASVATAPANGVGIVGLWPGLPVKVYRDQGTCSGAAAAVTAAAIDGARVINMSYGVVCFSHYVAEQFAFGLGSVLVSSAGNSFPNRSTLPRPANDPHVLTVAALAQDLSVAPFSTQTEWLDVAAPGVGIPAAVPVAQDADGTPDGYQLLDGTSFATPLVAAATAWVRTSRPDLSAVQATELMRVATTDVHTPGWDDRTGWGMINLEQALTLPAPFGDPAEPNEDIEWVDGRRFKPDPPLLRKRAAGAFTAQLDVFEDPEDVIPVYVPKRTRLRIDVVPRPGDHVDVEIFSRKARTAFYPVGKPPKTLKARGYLKGARREILFVTNPGPATIVYVQTYIPGTSPRADARYRFIARRTALPKGARCPKVTLTKGCLP